MEAHGGSGEGESVRNVSVQLMRCMERSRRLEELGEVQRDEGKLEAARRDAAVAEAGGQGGTAANETHSREMLLPSQRFLLLLLLLGRLLRLLLEPF